MRRIRTSQGSKAQVTSQRRFVRATLGPVTIEIEAGLYTSVNLGEDAWRIPLEQHAARLRRARRTRRR